MIHIIYETLYYITLFIYYRTMFQKKDLNSIMEQKFHKISTKY